MLIPLKLFLWILQSLYDNSVQVYPKKQLLQRLILGVGQPWVEAGWKERGLFKRFCCHVDT